MSPQLDTFFFIVLSIVYGKDELSCVRLLFDLLATFFAVDGDDLTSQWAGDQATRTCGYLAANGRGDAFDAMRTCLGWRGVGAETLGPAVGVLWAWWRADRDGRCRASILELFCSLRGACEEQRL
jgi:hypothetical protein